ncbi:MAG: macro domain-containing protein [Bacilli bacterium]|nr:macro domain-containing protein [Bacilli bacterium]
MYHNISIDITTFPGDCIVNSLGAGEYITQPGRIYRSILNAAEGRNDLWHEVADKGTNLPFGSVFMTDSFGLPSKKIIHVITPFRRFDRDYSQITKCYESLLQLALDSGMKSISVPLIGTGANGYHSDKVASIARRVCYRFAESHPEIEIFFNVYSVEFGPDEEELLREERCCSVSKTGGLPRDSSFRRDQDLGTASRPGDSREERPSKPKISFLEEIGIEDEDSFATLVRKCVFTRAKGSKIQKEAALEDVWLEINSLVGDFKTDFDTLEDTINTLHESKEKGAPVDKTLLMDWKTSHCPEYEWKKVKNGKGKGYVWQRPNKAEILLACIALHLKPNEVMEVYEFCGFSLSKYERHERAFRECVALIRSRNPWTEIVKAYSFATSESLYEYKEDRKKIYVDHGEKW